MLHSPLESRSNSDSITKFFIDAFDHAYLLFPNCTTFLCGDLNRYNSDSVQNNLDLINCVLTPTRGNAYLDYALLSPSLVDKYTITVSAPISNSDHNSIVCTPLHSIRTPRSYFKRTVYDLRSSFVSDFVDAVTHIDWQKLCCNDFDVNSKCIIFTETLKDCVKSTIPSFEVEMSDKDPLGSLLL